MECPKCGFEQPDAEECARCGIVVRKHGATPRTGEARTPTRRSRPAPLAHVATLKRAGLVLMLVGGADIAYMVYCLAKGRSYASSLNVFAVLAGILLYRGSLAAARVVAHAAAFTLAGLLGTVLLIPVVVPWDLLTISARVDPAGWAIGTATAGAIVVLLYWLGRQLTGEALADAFLGSGKEPPRTIISSVLGMVAILITGLVVRASLGGESAQQAVLQARQQVGPDYRFFVTAMSVTYSRDGMSGEATVLAYRPSEVRSLLVKLGSAERDASSAVEAPSGDALLRDAPGSVEEQVTAHVINGDELLRASNLPAAIEEYGAAIRINGSDANAYLRRAAAYGRTGEYDKALTDVDTAMALDPDRIGAYELADWILVHRRDWDGITARWTRFIETHPTSGKAYLERGGAYHHKGDEAAARRDVEQACALQHDPACQLLKRLAPPTAQ
jgi:tetratricopeptide (TPR) repeat protein